MKIYNLLLLIVSAFLFFACETSKVVNDKYKVSAKGITRYGLGKFDLGNSVFPIPPHLMPHET